MAGPPGDEPYPGERSQNQPWIHINGYILIYIMWIHINIYSAAAESLCPGFFGGQIWCFSLEKCVIESGLDDVV